MTRCPYCGGKGIDQAGRRCSRCGATITMPEGTTIQVTGKVAEEVEKVAGGLAGIKPSGSDDHKGAWSAVGVGVFTFAGAGAIALFTATTHVPSAVSWTLVGVAIVGFYLAIAPLRSMFPW